MRNINIIQEEYLNRNNAIIDAIHMTDNHLDLNNNSNLSQQRSRLLRRH